MPTLTPAPARAVTRQRRKAELIQDAMVRLRDRAREIRAVFTRVNPAFATTSFDLLFSLGVAFLDS